MAKLRGITNDQEVSSRRIHRNTKPVGTQFKEFICSRTGASMTIFGLTFAGMLLPFLMELVVIVSAVIFYAQYRYKISLPFSLPKASGLLDPANPNPAGKVVPAEGVMFLGNEDGTNQELWLSKSQDCTHTLMLATTGGGKTEALLSKASNYLAQGSSFVYVDGKADIGLLKKMYALAKIFNREDDLLVINYNTGGTDISFDIPDQKISNTLNPFSFGSSSSLTQLLVSLMSDSGGKGDFWKDRAISLVEAIIPALVWLRDKRGLLLDVSVIREYLNLGRIVELRAIKDMPSSIQESLKAYCQNLAGWQERKGAAQGDSTLEQHGYLQMQFTRTLGSLGDVYGHIFRTQLGEVDMFDVITNRRILVVMLPALEKAPPELANLGRVIVAILKNMMAASLGSQVEGDTYKVVDDRFTNADTAFGTIFDEYGYYSVDGSAVMPAQARSLNIAMTFAGQDYPAFKKSSEENAKSIIANCNCKVFGKLEDAEDSLELYKKIAGEVYVTNASGYKKSEGFLGGYSSSEDANIQTVSRANFLDLKDKKEGQMNIFFASKMVFANWFYANPGDPEKMRVNEFVRVRPPSQEVLDSIDESLSDLIASISDPEFHKELPEPAPSKDITFIVDELARHKDLSAAEKAAATLASYHLKNVAQGEESPDLTIEDLNGTTEDELNEVFGAHEAETVKKISLVNHASHNLDSDDLSHLTQQMMLQDMEASPGDALIAATIGEGMVGEANRSKAVLAGLVDEGFTHDSMVEIDRMSGLTAGQSFENANTTINELDRLTQYPQTQPTPMDVDEYVDALGMLDNLINDTGEF
ncbi:TraM recognition domain-containing protein [Methylobacillus sp. Pita2]|uniref:TraM recognition domain-containing protein n=1 Tax=Methylobacillus sp. Pita2 TaxID=3383245 RepID=UPI0038B5CC3D